MGALQPWHVAVLLVIMLAIAGAVAGIYFLIRSAMARK